jgi:hypothetical protein
MLIVSRLSSRIGVVGDGGAGLVGVALGDVGPGVGVGVVAG